MGKSTEKSYREARKERLNKDQKSLKNRTPRGVRRKKIKKGIIIGLIFLIIALLITGCSLNKAGVVDRKMVAFEVGGEEFTVADYNYWHTMISTQVMNNTYSYPDRKTVIDNTLSIISVAKAAEAKGYKLEGEMLENYNSTLSKLRSDCAAFDGSAKKFFNENYGFGTNEDIVMKNYKYQLLAIGYYNDFCDNRTYTDADYDNYYAGDGAQKLNSLDFKSCVFSSSEGNSFGVAYSSNAAALEAANRINASITNEESFDNAVKAEAKALGINDFKIEDVLEEDLRYDDLTNEDLFSIRDWLFSKDRKANDHTVITLTIDGQEYSYLMFLVSPAARENYKTVDMRHILISTTDSTTGEATEELKEAAKAKIEQIYAEWEETAMTDEEFAKLAKKYSADTTAEDGGLIEQVAKKQMVDGINNFLFSEETKVGDSKIILSDYGYHLVYYEGTNIEKWKLDAKSQLIERDFEAEKNNLCTEFNITTSLNDRIIDMFANEEQQESLYY